MGLIASMDKKGARAGVKLPVPTTAGDDQVIAAKTGEYVLPPEVVAAIGVEKLNALVQSITGQAPGGEPAEMPEGAMHEMMEGEMQGYALGGRIDPLAPLNSSAMRETEAGLKAMNTSIADTNRGVISGLKAAHRVTGIVPDQPPMMESSPRLSLAQLRELEAMGGMGEDSNILGYNKGGLISRMQGYAEGGIVEDDYTRRKLSGYNPQETIRKPEPPFPRANELRGYTPQPGNIPARPGAPAPADVQNLRNYNPQASIPPNATTNASPRAPELRTFTPEAGRLSPQPEGTYARPSGIAAEAPRGTPSRTIAELDARAAGKTPGAGPTMGQRVAGAQQGFQDARAARAATATPKPGLVSRIKGAPGMLAKGAAVTAPLAGFGDYQINDPGVDSSAGGVIGNLARGEGGKAWQGMKQGAVEAGLDSVAGLAKTADFAAGLVGADTGLQRAFDAKVQADIGPMLKRPEQVAAAPQLTPQELSDEIARRRAALEGPQAAPAPTANATPTQAIAAAPAPARGPVAGLAARAAKQSPAAPAAASIDPAVLADAQAAQAQLDQSPIARVVGGTGGTMTIQYKDGTTKQVGQEGMDEVNGFYALTSRAAKQWDAQPVEVIAGASRGQAVPELGYQVVPDAVARTGKTGDYVQSLSQAALDRADPVAAELRMLTKKTDEQIRASNATDRDGEGRGIRNELARLEFDLKKRALAGDQAAIQQLNMLRGAGSQDEYNATTREVPIDPTNPLSGTIKEPVIYNKRTGQIMGSGAVQSYSPPPQSAVAALRKDPKLAQQFDAKYGQGASAQYLNAR